MAKITVNKSIAAPTPTVFSTVAHVENFSKAVPHITKIEFLTDQKSGAGTRFRETRLMKGKEAQTELEVKEYVENERVRMVSDAGGTIWDTVFTTTPNGEGTELNMVMEARPHKFLARFMTPLIMGMVSKAVEADMDAVKEYCEKGSV